jgi:hypothetical protein
MEKTIVFAQADPNTIKSRTTNLESGVDDMNLDEYQRLPGDHHDLKTASMEQGNEKESRGL